MNLFVEITELLRRPRVAIAILLTAIGFFMVLWQRESTEFLLYVAEGHPEANTVDSRFYQQFESITSRDKSFAEEGASWTVRHKLRWAYKALEVSLYKAAERMTSSRIVRYVILLHYVAIFSLSYFFCLLILKPPNAKLDPVHAVVSGLFYIGFASAIFHVGGWEENFTPIEMLAIAIAIAASQRQNVPLFLIAVILAVSNRESGLAVGLIYPILNSNNWRAWLSYPAFGVFVLVALNFDLFTRPDFYDLKHFVIHPGVSYVTIMNFYEHPVEQWGSDLISYLSFVVPAFLLLPETLKSARGRRAWIIIAMYLTIILFGSILANSYLFLLLVPSYFLLGNTYFERQAQKTRQNIDA